MKDATLVSSAAALLRAFGAAAHARIDDTLWETRP
jgi:hypothetical protein